MKLSVLDQSPVRQGVTPADALRETIELAQHVDRLGYRRYRLAEHHSSPGLASTAPEILITRIAAETWHLRVGSGGMVLSHYNALKVAETFRTLGRPCPINLRLRSLLWVLQKAPRGPCRRFSPCTASDRWLR
jgi:luciferase family oxidoreductase group 1